MALKKLTTPGVNPGGVDKLYGEDWNRLIDALTGLVEEDISIQGILSIKHKIKSTQTASAFLLEAASNSYFAFSPVGATEKWVTMGAGEGSAIAAYMPIGNTYPQSWYNSIDTSALVARLFSSGSIAIASGAKILVDGAAGAGNSYIQEASADNVIHVVGGTTVLQLNASLWYGQKKLEMHENIDIVYGGADNKLAIRNSNAGGLSMYFHTGETARYAGKMGISTGSDITTASYLIKWDSALRTMLTVPNSAVTDADLDNSMMAFYLDQTNHKIKFRVKYSDGTLKTGELAVV